MRSILNGILVFFFIVVLAVTVGLYPLQDQNLWFHLATGRWIWREHWLPYADPFSYTFAHKTWINPDWLCDVALYGLMRAQGFAGWVMVQVTLIFFVLIFLVRIARRSYPVPSGLLLTIAVLMTALALPVLTLGPGLVSLFFSVLFFWALSRYAVTPHKWIFWLVVVQILWINSHASSLAGLAMATLVLGTGVFKKMLGQFRGSLTGILVLVLFLALVSLINPYSYDLVVALAGRAHYFLAGSKLAWIKAWESLVRGEYDLPPHFYFVFFAVCSHSVAVKKLDLFFLGMSVALGGLVLLDPGFLAVFALFHIPILARNLSLLVALFSGHGAFIARATNVVMGAFAIVIVGVAVTMGLPIKGLDQPWAELLTQKPALPGPNLALDVLQRHPHVGPVFHASQDSGYLAWRGVKVFIDARGENFYPEDFIAFYEQAFEQTDVFEKLRLAYDFRHVLIPHQPSALLDFLLVNPDWRLLYDDGKTIMFDWEGTEDQRFNKKSASVRTITPVPPTVI